MQINPTLLLTVLIKDVVCVDLYGGEDEVIFLEKGTFTDALTGRPHAWLVEFYASWCGHCRSFAPVYKQFAKEVAFWGDIIRIGAIDCAEADNEEVCQKYDIKGYPALKYFPPSTSPEELGQLRESHEKSIQSLKYDTIDYLQSIRDTLNLTEWPSFNPLPGIDWNEEISQEKTELFLILEEDSSYIGREVLLDIHQAYDGAENVARLIYSSSLEDKLQVELSELPALLLLDVATSNITIVATSISVEEIERIIYNHYHGILEDPASSQQDQSLHGQFKGEVLLLNQEEPEDEEQQRRRRYTLSLTDLEKTAVYALTHEVPAQGELNTDQFEALKKFLVVLAEFFPPSSSLIYILTKLTFINQTEAVGHVEALLKERVEYYDSLPWNSCRGSQPQFGGYPCGQWMLWHVLTVRQLQEQRGPPTQVLQAMNAYVKNFFGCSECAAHFVNMTRNEDDFESVNSYQDAVLYLWEKHNEVNQRLMHAASEDPAFPKFTFPSLEQCRGCYTPAGGFSRPEVLNFLTSLYGGAPEDDRSTASAAERPTSLRTLIFCLVTLVTVGRL